MTELLNQQRSSLPMGNPGGNAEFDEFAEGYEESLQKGLSVSGETKDFFVRGRVRWVARAMARMGARAQSVLDFGCGIGDASPALLAATAADRVHGVDLSAKEIEIARQRYQTPGITFEVLGSRPAEPAYEMAYCNGVFHHIPLADRDQAVDWVYGALKPGGLFMLFENNPWNPGTRYVMSRIPFDRDAIMLWPREARRRLRRAGFSVLTTAFLFVFPNILRRMRCLEPALESLPLGAQYVVAAQKPPEPSRQIIANGR
jgi:SAM-dependent methyltransferase